MLHRLTSLRLSHPIIEGAFIIPHFTVGDTEPQERPHVAQLVRLHSMTLKSFNKSLCYWMMTLENAGDLRVWIEMWKHLYDYGLERGESMSSY